VAWLQVLHMRLILLAFIIHVAHRRQLWLCLVLKESLMQNLEGT
jgi:hypothetical protein